MREKEQSTKIIYVRHGKTDFPADRIYCDDIEDPELNAEGIKQVESASKYFKGKDIAAVYVSPIKRTLMTAKEIEKVTGAPLFRSEALKERNFGILQGLFFNEIKNDYALEFDSWKKNPAGFKPDGGESIYDTLERIKGIIGEIIARYIGKTVVVVSHVGPIRVAIADALKMPVELYRQIYIDHASLSRIDYGKSQNNFIYMNIISYNSTDR